MTLTRRDATATVLTGLAALVFAASHEGWSVPLVGDSHRWAAGAILMLGVWACAQGDMKDRPNPFLMVLGVGALPLALAAVATGSLTLLSLLVGDVVLLWALSTVEHARHGHAPTTRPVAT